MSRSGSSEGTEQEILSPEARQNICQFYGIGSVGRWAINERGLVNVNYELDDGYFLTIHRRRTHDQIEAIAQVAHSMDDAIPITRPTRGEAGYAMKLETGSTLLNPRLNGVHHVGIAHTEKHQMPLNLHRSLAVFFWELQKRLSSVSEQLKARLKACAVTNIGEMPKKLPDAVKPLMKYAHDDNIPAFTYPDLIHDDLERQNILSVDDRITGLVDLDSIRSGDILYEFGHFLFNFVLNAPEGDLETVALYINELIKAGVINPKDIPALYSHIFQFAISDVIEFQALSSNPAFIQHKMIDLDLLVSQYDRALGLAATFFKKEFSL